MLAIQYSHGSYYTKNKRPVKNIEYFFYELQIMYLAYQTVKAVWFLESELEADVLICPTLFNSKAWLITKLTPIATNAEVTDKKNVMV